MKNRQETVFLLVAAMVLVISCERKPAKTKEQVMQERLAERLERWETDMLKKCRKEVEDKAIALTDSIVIANAKLNRDTSIQSLIPGRPTRPDYKPPTDSVKVKPFLNE